MKLEDTRRAFYYNSGKASDGARTLALAGVGIVWLFRANGDGGSTVPRELALPLLLFVGALSADLVQYVAGTIVWHFYNRHKETADNIQEESEFLAPPTINWPTTTFFILKLACLVAGYLLVFRYLSGKVL